MVALTGKFGLTVMDPELAVTKLVVWQVLCAVISTDTLSPLVIEVDEKEVPVCPLCSTPSTFHTKEGLPPLTGVAVKVKLLPEQMVGVTGETLTEGVT